VAYIIFCRLAGIVHICIVYSSFGYILILLPSTLLYSHKMPTDWRSWPPRNCASITPRTSIWNVELLVSTTLYCSFNKCAVNGVSLFLGGREKAPAAFSRKAITSTEFFEMWGDGKQTRSFTFIDECVEGVLRYVRMLHHWTESLIKRLISSFF
jgi:hypothetical protein